MANHRAPNIRWLFLLVLLAQRQEEGTEIGGWLAEEPLRRLLAAEGYPLSREEVRTYGDYLADPRIACIEAKNAGNLVTPRFKYRLTAQGMRAAGREITVPGVGITGDD